MLADAALAPLRAGWDVGAECRESFLGKAGAPRTRQDAASFHMAAAAHRAEGTLARVRCCRVPADCWCPAEVLNPNGTPCLRKTRALLEGSPPGILALSDLHGCHDPVEPDEWLHAVYQAGAHGGAGRQQAIKAAFTIASKKALT